MPDPVASPLVIASGQVWHIPSPAPITFAQFTTLISEEVGHPVKATMASSAIVRVMGLFNPVMRETIEMMYEWNKPFIMDSSKFERTFNAIRETLASFRAQPAHALA